MSAGRSFVVPTTWNGEVVLRLCIVNPLTSAADIALVIDSLEIDASRPDGEGAVNE